MHDNKKNHFHKKGFFTRFKTEACGISEMAYFTVWVFTYTVEACLVDTIASGPPYLRPPCQMPFYFLLNVHANSVFPYSHTLGQLQLLISFTFGDRPTLFIILECRDQEFPESGMPLTHSSGTADPGG